LTSYVGISGYDFEGSGSFVEIPLVANQGGIFDPGVSGVRITDITDGTAHTPMIGESPPSIPSNTGTFPGSQKKVVPMEAYVTASNTTSSALTALPIKGLSNSSNPNGNLRLTSGCTLGGLNGGCRYGGPKDVTNSESYAHIWSMHSGGANFAMGDGSVRFISYSAEDGTYTSPMLALSTRAGGEATPTDFWVYGPL
jgi:prepilin-type processing-associated H-X9-DG protein